MRILHVDTARGWRGGQNQVLLTAKGMERRGHEVIVACRTASGTVTGSGHTFALTSFIEPPNALWPAVMLWLLKLSSHPS